MKQAHINLLKSIFYLFTSLCMLSVVSYAWFTITDENNAKLVSKISGVEAEYKFYSYKNITHLGSNELTLIDNVCDVNNLDDLCYEEVKNPIYPKLIEGSVAPGERFSFAIAISSVGTTQGYVDLTLGNLESLNYDLDVNKIQTAFGFEVTKISYIHLLEETNDVKEGLKYQSFIHFSSHDSTYYPLIEDVPLIDDSDLFSTVVIYFDVYYDPLIYGMDINGVSYTNSNIFMNQTFNIKDIYMNVTSNKQS